ncbi:hypothetical protein BGZ95_008529 [Linnemannia exigua]|uniref:F-box domain-containing protein n=1 Tax=Linnemannia exigua TaxID=604196 RepID=A0AAD4H6C0_9FUNG|nr:hypothetical protein BGZ95_008529 [Linnemannia exigua]
MTSSSTTSTKSACLLPEVLATIGSFLDPPSLLPCLQVNKAWHHIFLPLLWGSIDDSLYSWPTILEQHDTQQPHGNGNTNIKDEAWLRTVFTKHGHLIRHLTIHWIPTLDAVGLSNTCTRLLSLSIRNTQRSVSDEEKEHRSNMCDRGFVDADQEEDERLLRLPDEYSLSPLLGNALHPSKDWRRSDKKHRQDWMSGQRFWMLVLNNPRLRKLVIGRHLKDLCGVRSVDILNDIIAGLHSLTTLENTFYNESLETTLTRNLALTSFRSELAFPNTILSATFLGMRSLATHNLGSRNLFLILHHLPNLHSLECNAIGLFDVKFCPDAGQILEGQPSKLRRLVFTNFLRIEHSIATHVFPWLPHLQELTCRKRISLATANALIANCPDLEVLREEHFPEPIHCFQTPREERNSLLQVLQECSKLRVFDTIHHRIDADLLTEKPFACAGLEMFRCQVVVTERVKLDDTGVAIPPERTSKALQDQQHRIYDHLAVLTQLSTLDLGYLWRNIDASYIERGGPIECTLELTLESGLDRLSTLKNLQVFGFEGVDFKLGKLELEWMVANWPRLRILRGLQQDDTLPGLVHDKRKAELCEYMQVLKPEVQHQLLRLDYGFE